MKNKSILMRLFLLAAVFAMVAVMCFSLASCKNNEPETPETTGGAATIQVTVIHGDGTSKVFDIDTTEGATLGSALKSIDLIEGDEGPFGLYVKVVDGERADYDADGAYWGFEQNGTMMMEGIDSVRVKDGDKFEIAYTKG